MYYGEYDLLIIEMIANYKMEIDTTIWIGRFKEIAEYRYADTKCIYRKDKKISIHNNTEIKDSKVIQALIDKFRKY